MRVASHLPVSDEVEQLAASVVDAAFQLHRALGPTLREAHYQRFLHHALRRRGHTVERELRFPLEYDGLRIENALRIDLVVDASLIVEIKADYRPYHEHESQVLSYLEHTGLPIALLVNFRAPLFRNGVRRYINAHPGVPSPHLAP